MNSAVKEEGEVKESSLCETQQPPSKEASWLIKLSILACVVFFASGSHYGNSAVKTLKTEIKDATYANNTQYAIIDAAINMVNTIFPLFGGVMIDKIGAGGGSLASAICVLIGEIFIAAGISVGSYPCLLIGRIIHGLGVGIISIAQETLLSNWFSGSGLGLALGIQIASSRMFGWLGKSTSIPINQAIGSTSASLWFSVGLSGVGICATVCYIWIAKSARSKSRGFDGRLGSRKGFSLKVILYLPAVFWLIPLCAFVYGGIWNPFMGNVKVLVEDKWHYSGENAAFISSITRGVPIFLSPLTGFILDRIGLRGPLLVICNVLLILCFILIEYTSLLPYTSLVLYSINEAVAVVVLISSIPLIVPQHLIATGISLYRVSTSSGGGIFSIAWGMLQDSENGGYLKAINMMIGLSIIAMIAAIIYYISDVIFSHSLLNSSNRNRKLIKEKYFDSMTEDSAPTLTVRPTAISIVSTSLLAIIILICWTFFIYVLVKGNITDQNSFQ